MWLYCAHQTQFISPHSSWYLGLVKWIHHLYNAHIDQTEHTQLAFTVCINFSKKVVSSLITSLRSGVDSKLHLRWPWRDRALSAWNQTPGLFYLLSAGAKAKKRSLTLRFIWSARVWKHQTKYMELLLTGCTQNDASYPQTPGLIASCHPPNTSSFNKVLLW